MKNTLVIITWIVLGVIIGSIGTIVILMEKHDRNTNERCSLYAKYDPNARAWYWQVPINDEYFETREDTINHCEDYWRLN